MMNNIDLFRSAIHGVTSFMLLVVTIGILDVGQGFFTIRILFLGLPLISIGVWGYDYFKNIRGQEIEE